MIEDSAREAKTAGPLAPYLRTIYYTRLPLSEIYIYVLYKMHFPRSFTSGTNLTFTGTGIHPALHFSMELFYMAIKILLLSHQPNLLCFFNPFQDSQQRSILRRDRTRGVPHIHERFCPGKTAEQGQTGSFPESPASSAHEKSALWITKHRWVFSVTHSQAPKVQPGDPAVDLYIPKSQTSSVKCDYWKCGFTLRQLLAPFNLLNSSLLHTMVKAGPAVADSLRARILKSKINFSIEGCHLYSRVSFRRFLQPKECFCPQGRDDFFGYFELGDGLQVIPTA